MVRCAKCGKENAEGNRFCVHCGVSLAGAREVASDSQPVVSPSVAPQPDTPSTTVQQPSSQTVSPQVVGLALSSVRSGWNPEPLLVAITFYITISALGWLIVGFWAHLLLIDTVAYKSFLEHILGSEQADRTSGLWGFLGSGFSFVAFLVSATSAIGLWRLRRWAVGWTVATGVLGILGNLVLIVLGAEHGGGLFVLYYLLFGVGLAIMVIICVLRPEVQFRLQ